MLSVALYSLNPLQDQCSSASLRGSSQVLHFGEGNKSEIHLNFKMKIKQSCPVISQLPSLNLYYYFTPSLVTWRTAHSDAFG